MCKNSLKWRLTLWYTILMLVVSVIVLSAAPVLSQRMVKQNSRKRIIQTVDAMAMQLKIPPDSEQPDAAAEDAKNKDSEKADEDLPPRAPPPRFYENGVHMVLFDENNDVIQGQIPFSITDEMDFKNGVVRKEIYDGNKYLVYDKELSPVDGRGKTAYIKGFISIDENKDAILSALKNNLIVTITLILIAAVGGYVIASRALTPVSKISEAAKSIIQNKDLSRRINIGKSKGELAILANTFDEMLSEIQEVLEREQQFTSDASHELRTPIAVILSECEYMIDCADTVEELKCSAESVKEEARRMSKLISELLTLCRMDRQTLCLNFEKINVSELLRFVCAEQAEINDSDITLTENIAPGILADADRFLIARLFINLISNAYKYNQKGGSVFVSLQEQDKNMIFTVSDTGVGIKKEYLSKIWLRFYQVDPSRTSNENGSMGLGLSMVKWIAKEHGGEITVQSEVGKGSTFTFVMPKTHIL